LRIAQVGLETAETKRDWVKAEERKVKRDRKAGQVEGIGPGPIKQVCVREQTQIMVTNISIESVKANMSILIARSMPINP
jgi:hypothetical protein